MPDERTYIRVHDGLDEHPKVEPLSDAAFRLLMNSWFYCSRNRTDGQIKDVVWKRRGTPKARRELLEAGLVEQRDGHIEMHDYLEHQRSAEEIRLLQETRGDSGSFGNHVRWHVVKRKPKPGCEHCDADRDRVANPIASAIAKPSQTDRKAVASTEAEAEAEDKNSSGGGSHVSRDSGNDAPPAYPDHCADHAHVAVPPKCGGCQKQKALNVQRPRLSVVASTPARVPHCGQCDEYRMVETAAGLKRCPACNPLAGETINEWMTA